jgi:hypothetical protein
VAEGIEIAILAGLVDKTRIEFDGPRQGFGGLVGIAAQGIDTGAVVMRQSVLIIAGDNRLETEEGFIDPVQVEEEIPLVVEGIIGIGVALETLLDGGEGAGDIPFAFEDDGTVEEGLGMIGVGAMGGVK